MGDMHCAQKRHVPGSKALIKEHLVCALYSFHSSHLSKRKQGPLHPPPPPAPLPPLFVFFRVKFILLILLRLPLLDCVLNPS